MVLAAKLRATSDRERMYSLGRREDQRAPFERDRDRILYTSAFLRLAGITQVVHASEGHVFHNRLTHSLKVAQIARRLSEHLVREHQKSANGKRLLASVGGIEPEVAEAAGLAHDLGHPPFGHLAEEVLDGFLLSTAVSDRDGFEGNPQTFRILTKLAIRSSDHRGLNLTARTLNAVLKYPHPRGARGKKHRKWGHYSSEAPEFRFARSPDARDKRRSIEAEIMDWADDVTYAVHDVDDFFRAGIIPLDRLLRADHERDRFAQWAAATLAVDRGVVENFFDQLGTVYQLQPFSGTREQRARLDRLVTFLIKRYVVGPDGGGPAVQLNDDRSKPRLDVDLTVREEVEILKGLTRFYVFSAPALVAQQHGQRRVIRDLAEIFYEALGNPSSKPRRRAARTAMDGLIPEPFRNSPSRDGDRRSRVVTDIITSMTEQQALVLHQRLMGFAPGSVRDVILY